MTYMGYLVNAIKAAAKRLNYAEATVEYFDGCLTNPVCREAVADANERADRAYLDLIEAEEALDQYLEGQPTSEEAAAGRQDPEVQARLVAAKAEADAKAKAEADMKWFAACDAREAVAAAKRAEKTSAAKAEAEKFANIALAAGWQGNDIFSLAIEGKKIAKAEADAKAIAEAAAKAAAKSEAATKAKAEAEKAAAEAAEAARIERERIAAEKAEAAKAEAKANRERVSAALSAATKATVTTKAPETTKATVTTKAPETTKAPVTTKKPETTKAPETKSGLKAILAAIGSAVAAFVTMIVAFFTGIGLKCKLHHAGKKLIAEKAEFSAQQGNVSPFAIVVRRSTKWMKRTWKKVQARTQFNNWASLMAHSFEPIGLREARKASIATATLGQIPGWWDGEGDGRRSADYDTPSEVRDFEKATDAIIEKHGLEGAIKALQEARSPLKVNITGWIYSYLNIQSFADVLFKRSGKTPAEFATEMVSKGMNPDEIWKVVGKLGDDEFVQILDLIGPTYVLGTQLTFDQKDACSCRKGHFNQLYSWIGYGHYRPEVVSRVLKKTEFILKGEEWLRYGSDRAEDAEEALKLALHEGATVTMSQEDFDNLPIDIQEVVARVLPGYHSELAKLGYPDFYRVNQIPGHCGEYTWTYVIAQDGSLRPADYCEVIRRANGKPMTGNFNCIWKQIQPGDAIFNISAYGMKNPIKFKWDLVPQWLSAEQLRTAQQLVRGEFAGEENRWFVNWGPETDYSQWVEELFKAPQVKVDTFDERPMVDELGGSVHPVEWDELENNLDEGLKKQLFKLPGTFGGLQFFAAHPSKAQLYGYALKKEAEAARKYYEETEGHGIAHKAWRKEDGSKCLGYNQRCYVSESGTYRKVWEDIPSPKAILGNADSAETRATRFEREIVYIDADIVDAMNSVIADISIGDYKRVAFTDTCGRSYLLGHNDGKGLVGKLVVLSEGYNADKAIVITCDADKLAGVNNRLCLNGTVEVEIESNRYENILWIRRYDEIMPQAVKNTIVELKGEEAEIEISGLFGNESMCLDWHILNNVAVLGYSQTAIDNETNVSPEKETGNIQKEVSGMKDQNLIKRVSATAELMTIKGDLIVERQRVDDAITKVKATIRRLRRLVVEESGEMAGIKGYGRKRVELANGFASEGKTLRAEEVMTEVNRLVELYVDASLMRAFYSKELEDKLGVLKQLEMYRKDIVAAINEAEAAEAEGKEVDDPTRDVTDFEAVIERGQDFVIRDELSDRQGRIVEGGKIIEIGAFKQLTARTFTYPNAKAGGNLKKISISVKNGTFKVPGFKAIETADKGASRVYAVKDAAEATRLLKSARFTTDLDCFEEIVINYELGELKLKPNVLKTIEVKEVSSEDLEAKAVAEAEAEARKDRAQDLINKKLGYKSELEFQAFEARTDYKVQFVSMYGNADMKDNAAKAVEEVELERAKAAKQSIDEVNAAEKAAGIFLSYIFMSNEDKKTEKGYALSSLEACYVMYLKKVRNMRNELEEAQGNLRSERLKNIDSKRITSAQQKVDSLQNKLQRDETELCEIYDDLCKAAEKAKVVISKEIRDLIMAEEHISAKRKALKPLSEASAKATKAYNEAVKGEDEALIAKANEALKAANKALFDAKGEFAKAIRAYDEAFRLCIKCVKAYKTITLSFTSEEMNDKVISLGKAAFKDMDTLIHWLSGYNRGPKVTIKTGRLGLREVQDAQSEADRETLSEIRCKGFAAGLLSKLVDETVDKDGNAKLVKGVRNVDTATAVVGYFGDVMSDYAEESTNRIAAVNELLDKKLENGKTIRDYLEYFKQQREKRATKRAVDKYYYSENVGVTSARFQLDRDYQALKEARYGRDEEIVTLLDETDEYVQKLFARDMAYVNAQSKASQVIWAFVACCLNNNRILTLINGIKDEFAAAHPGVNINISRWAAFMHPAIWDAWHVMNLIRNEINYRHNGSQIAFVNAVIKFCAIIQKYDKGVRGSGSAWAHNIGAIARMAEFDADDIYNALDEKNERGQTLYGQIELAFASNGTKSPTKTVVRSIVEHRVPSTGQLAEAGKYGEYDGAHGNTAALELIDGDAELGGKKSYRNLNFDDIKETIALGCVDFEVAREKVVSTINLDGSLIVWYGNLICEKAANFGSCIFGAMSVWKDALASEDHKMPWESYPIGGLEPGNKDFDEAYEERFSKATCTNPEDLVIFEDWINSVCKDWLEFKKFEEEVFEPAKEAYEQAKRDKQNHNGAETILNMALEAAEFEYNNAKDQLDSMYEICLEQGRSEYLMKILVGDRYDTYDDVAKTNQYVRDINNG